MAAAPVDTIETIKRLAGYIQAIEQGKLQGENKEGELLSKAKVGQNSELKEDPARSQKRSSIHRQEFLWDSIIQWLVAAIFGLTLLNISADFFRNYTVACHVETNRRDEVVYINNYCHSSLPRSEYFTLYILIHGFMIIGPHVLWKTTTEGYINFFFDLASSLDQLKDRMTGDYSPRNFDVVTKMEKEFSQTVLGWKIPLLFGGYTLKLGVQILVTIGSIVFSATFFDNFSEIFPCPRYFDGYSYGWYLNSSVTCVYPSIRFLALMRYADFFLLSLILIVLLYTLLWVVMRHKKELGHLKIAEFCSQCCLIPEDYECKLTKYVTSRYDCIRTDMDFLIMMLFRASSGKGATLKEMLIQDLMKRHYGKDSELLQLFLNQEDDVDRTELFKQARFRSIIKGIGKKGSPRFEVEATFRPKLGLANDMEKPPDERDILRLTEALRNDRSLLYNDLIDKLYNEIGETWSVEITNEKRFKQALKVWCKKGGKRKQLRKVLKDAGMEEIAKEAIGEQVTEMEIKSFQNRVYSFLQLVKPHQEGMNRLLAMDISFDGLGCTFILEWALESVCSINFHSHFHNNTDPVGCDKLYNQITLIRLPTDFFSLPGTDQTKLDKYLDEIYFDCTSDPPRMARRSGVGDENDRYINFFTVGPIKEDARRVTVNLLLELLHNGKDIADNCFMLAVRPLMIAGNFVGDKYIKYVPSYSLFEERMAPQRRIPTSASLPAGGLRVQTASRQMSLPVSSDRERLLGPSSSPPASPPLVEESVPSVNNDPDSFRNVGFDKGIVCYCAGIECVFEMKLYRYKHKQERIDV